MRRLWRWLTSHRDLIPAPGAGWVAVRQRRLTGRKLGPASRRAA